MKQIKKIALIFASVLSLALTSCEKEKKIETPDNKEQILFNGNEIGNGSQEFEIKGTHTLKKGKYVIKGWIYITDGASLTIEAGSVIRGDKDTKAALIVETGGKIFAQGTADEPIVFTSNQPAGSRKPGDWGGIIICGKAKNNKGEMIIEGGPRSKHGGNNDEDNSGVLSYVRIEFAGYPFRTDQEINGLTMGSVGRGTKIDHIQVSYSNDDAFEWFGGAVNSKYLVAFNTWDDGFDTDSGFSGKIQFGLIIQHPRVADVSRSNGFESDNNADAPNQQPITSPVFSNITIIGPIGQDPLFQNTSAYINGGVYNPNNGSKLGQHQAAIQIRRGSNLSLFNSVATGYPVGLAICNDKGSQTQEAATAGKVKIQNVYFAGMTILGTDKDGSYTDSLSVDASKFDKNASESFSSSFFKLQANSNTYLSNISSLLLKNASSPAVSGNWAPLASSPLLNKSNLFTDPKVADSFFDKVNFIGAFRSDAAADNWTLKWTNFDPQNTVY
ncbi:MAG: hypothetical protein Q8R90_02000 [Bacteroidales bacterium]|nr:hypothetical protein [Bacteroidales bacterium]MDZ4058777.1 hypothetical protein [Bacteroidales bacterium]